ncbi:MULTISPECIES: hypothetical protein [Nocardia]|uniref:Uncharacterized protein n=1 Tax=Nocardia fluminea TaxID=134984 RepID=A0A2N3VCL1_9NOCA|nr:hypothetical protein [Nocardia fluminea]PKV79351.1 hypothetical protein ATK86_3743 [Nocardia fluminea]
MFITPSPSAVIAAELHRVFVSSPHAADSLELWLAVAAEAERALGVFVPPALVPWVPIFVRYRLLRTEGEFFPFTGSTRIMTGPLAGTTYTSLDHAAHAVVGATPVALPPFARRDEVTDTTDVRRPLPSWRFRATGTQAAKTPRTVPPLLS